MTYTPIPSSGSYIVHILPLVGMVNLACEYDRDSQNIRAHESIYALQVVAIDAACNLNRL
jgi:hypothetical protein